MYIAFKFTHAVLAAATIAGFILRGYWMMTGSSLLRHPVTRVLPHVVDTLFLVSGIGLVVALSLSVGREPWLIIKLIGLVAYIALGMIALKRGRTATVRTLAFVAAVAVYAYIVGAALSKSPLSWLALLTV